jgi:predicted RNA polymerase sigma factor
VIGETVGPYRKSGGSTSPLPERAMRALAAMAEKKPAEAIALLEPVTFDPGHSEIVNIWSIAKILTGDLPAAARGLAFMNSRDARTGLTAVPAYAYAMLARVRAQIGQTAEARATYQKFFDLWKDADPDLPLLVQAREDFAKLAS